MRGKKESEKRESWKRGCQERGRRTCPSKDLKRNTTKFSYGSALYFLL